MNKKDKSLPTKPNKKRLFQEASLKETARSERFFQSAEGSPEAIALVTGRLSESNQKKALEIIEKKEDNFEKERKRQYQSFNKIQNRKFIIFLIVFSAFIGLDIFLYVFGHLQTANYLTTAIISLGLGFLGGRGYEKNKK